MSVHLVEDIYPLSPMQQGMLFRELRTPDGQVYFKQLQCTLAGQLDVVALRRAWQRLVDRHPVLRTVFVWEKVDEPVQVVYRQVELPFAQEDWRGLEPAEQERRLAELVAADSRRAFDLSKAPLMRLTLVRLSEEMSRFVWSYHHLLLDGWSVPLCFAEVLRLYEEFRRGRDPQLAPARPFRDYISWLQDQDLDAAEAFWRDYLEGFTEPTFPGLERIGEDRREAEEWSEIRRRLTAELTDAVGERARRQRLTLNVVAQGAWALLLGRYCGKSDVVFGATVSGRPAELTGVESIVGLFINSLPVRIRARPQERLVDWLHRQQVRHTQLRRFEYSPLVEVQRWSELPREEALFKSLLVFENYPTATPREDGSAAGRLVVRDVHSLERTEYPLTLELAVRSRLTLLISYQVRHFDRTAVRRLAAHLENLLAAMLVDGGQRVGDLSPLGRGERHQLLLESNDSARQPGSRGSICEIFESQAARSPDSVAAVFEHRSVSYGELRRRVARLAGRLREIGVGPEPVALLASRGIDFLCGVLAVFRAGGAYLPLDPHHPPPRIAQVLERSRARLVLVAENHHATLAAARSELAPASRPRPLSLEKALEHAGRRAGPASFQGDLAYVIYTSGSTGTPKGAMVEQRGMLNHMWAKVRDLELTADDVVAQTASQCFDISVWQFLAPLFVGGRVQIFSDEVAHDPHHLLREAERRRITVLEQVPSLMRLLLDEVENPATPPPSLALRWMIPTGEALAPELCRRWFAACPDVPLLNAYGPTECSDDVSHHVLRTRPPRGALHVPIGRPVANTSLYVLDRRLRPVPSGVEGQLFVGGIGVGRGYFDEARKTARVFVPDPFAAAGRRLYATGDLARWLPGGELEFRGRTDHQVKVRGLRIELGEIEAVLASLPEVRECAVVVQRDERGESAIVAHVVPGGEGRVESMTAAWKDHLSRRLPGYMVPAAFTVLESLPLTRNGKVDRRALSAMESVSSEPLSSSPVALSWIEETVAGIWSELLGPQRTLRPQDDFFELGGHSLTATRLLSRLRSVFRTELSMRSLFDAPTLGQMSAHVAATLRGPKAAEPPALVKVSRDRDLPLSFAQRRLWFLDQLEPGSAAYVVPTAVRLRGALDTAALRHSAQEVVRRHESLRTVFSVAGDEPVQVIRPPVPLLMPVIDLTALPRAARQEHVRQLTGFHARRPFDLERGPLYRCALLRLDEEEHVFVWTMHHIVADGWARDLLIAELAALYHAFLRRRSCPLPEPPIQYADFAYWQRQWLTGEVLEDHLSYWRKQLEAVPCFLELPTDRPRSGLATSRGAHHRFSFPNTLVRPLKNLSYREAATPVMTLLAVLKVVLWRWTGQEDVVVGSNIANRNRTELEGLIGFFVNMLPLRTQLSPDLSFRELLARVRDVSLSAYSHQDLPFDMLIQELRLERDSNRTPLVQVVLNYETAAPPAPAIPDLVVEPLAADNEAVKFDLVLTISDLDEQLKGAVIYNSELFYSSTIAGLVRHLELCLTLAVEQPAARLKQLVEALSADEKEQAARAHNRFKDLSRAKFGSRRRKVASGILDT